MEYPVAVALSETADELPVGPGWWYEPAFEGERLVLHRTARAVRCQSRSGRTVTTAWPDLAAAGRAALPAGTVLDGEAVVWTGGRLDLAAARARAAAPPRGAGTLAAERPASYAVSDCLALGGEDLRGRPYAERRAVLLDLLHDVPPPLQPVPATDDPEVARVWLEGLAAQGVDGVVAKRGGDPYRAERIWVTVRGGARGSVEVEVVGYVGPPSRPHRAAVRLPDGSRALSQALTAPAATALARHVQDAGPGRRARTAGGERYTTTAGGLFAEIALAAPRDGGFTVVRLC
ncbi:ATP-dependent DNA ligase [Streptomyces xanthii]|uniref:ATP-dependent DNA ligase family profile domain-containing protein n=1 Tax=Streptomyces xanthii TaxID=2768069 RepID=A0A7H1BGV4_9ACTN|nr:hypothetical protein [Streptomyces xanthii]QNS07959.1 hypothetical protein IAG42_33020 [Streptomyces xanthii]